ncbi:MAG: hypothetical protein K9K67_08970 [Bacteriovoracaceae bacterium]|nr:hypothetical protein [Bacteriovoracaceae bacterium]
MKLHAFILLSFLATTAFGQEGKLDVQEVNRRVEILADEINALKAYQTNVSKNESVFGLGNSASKIYHIPQGLSIGGYAEMTYFDTAEFNQSGASTNKNPTTEVLRNILYFGYKFNDKWLANMELEIEHVGQVYTEFLYVDYLHSQNINFRAGLLLHPMGFLNELHEPVLYPSVSRPELETVLIPTTWRELGAGIFGSLGNTTYKFYVMNGMNADDFSSSSNRGGRKRGGFYIASADKDKNQRASSAVAILRLDHQVNNWLSLGGSILKGNASGANDQLGQTMAELHMEAQGWGHKLRVLGVQNQFHDVREWNVNNSASLADTQRGYYAEYTYKLGLSGTNVLQPFFRYENIDMQYKVPVGVTQSGALDYEHIVAGIGYLPLDRLIFKFDYTWERTEDRSGEKIFGLGIGYNY